MGRILLVSLERTDAVESDVPDAPDGIDQSQNIPIPKEARFPQHLPGVPWAAEIFNSVDAVGVAGAPAPGQVSPLAIEVLGARNWGRDSRDQSEGARFAEKKRMPSELPDSPRPVEP